MGILLIVMFFLAMVGVGWWELQRSRRRFQQAKDRLQTIYSKLEDSQDSEDEPPSSEKLEKEDQA